MAEEARFWEKADDGSVRCRLCPHACLIAEGHRGICGVRENREGVLYSLVYGRPCTLTVDPIEKKPLFHFLPGTGSLSLATAGCNFRCRFCQNHSISQVKNGVQFDGEIHAPGEITAAASERNIQSISCTYTEPTVFFEYAYDIGIKAREQGIRNVFVSNGFMSGHTRDACLDFLDAINCDLKCFSSETYRNVIGGELQPVLDTIAFFRENGIWVEVTTLLVTDMNDSDSEIEQIAEFLVSVDPAIPWHVSRFHPTYKMNERLPTPVERIEKAVEIGKEAGLRFVYAGNVHGSSHEHTVCPGCGSILIRRIGFSCSIEHMQNGTCLSCGENIEGVWCGS